jgi:heme-degrading monooxygenase HmoA
MPDGTDVYSILRIPVRPGSEDAFADRFAQLRIFELCGESGTLRAARLLRPTSDATSTFVVVAEWDSIEAYQGWLDNPLRERLSLDLESLLDGEMSGGAFSVAHAYDGR